MTLLLGVLGYAAAYVVIGALVSVAAIEPRVLDNPFKAGACVLVWPLVVVATTALFVLVLASHSVRATRWLIVRGKR